MNSNYDPSMINKIVVRAKNIIRGSVSPESYMDSIKGLDNPGPKLFAPKGGNIIVLPIREYSNLSEMVPSNVGGKSDYWSVARLLIVGSTGYFSANEIDIATQVLDESGLEKNILTKTGYGLGTIPLSESQIPNDVRYWATTDEENLSALTAIAEIHAMQKEVFSRQKSDFRLLPD